MRIAWVLLVCLLLNGAAGFGQDVAKPAANQAQSDVAALGEPGEAVTVFTPRGSVSMPRLEQTDLSTWMATKCEQKFSGKTVLGMIVDTQGHARNIRFLTPGGNDADRLSVIVALLDRFTPAKDGERPVPVAISIEMKLDACAEKKDGTTAGGYVVKLRNAPVQSIKQWTGAPARVRYARNLEGEKGEGLKLKVGGTVSAPIPLLTPEAEFSDKGRRERIQGECMITTMVDAHGLPLHPRVVKSLEASMDEKAMAAVWKYRFKPAMRDGEPVPVMITIAVNFRLDETRP